MTDDLELHYIELPKFTPDKPKSVQTRLEKWLYVLKFSDLYQTRELPENLRSEEGIQMAIDSMRKAYARDDIRAVIEAQEKAERDHPATSPPRCERSVSALRKSASVPNKPSANAMRSDKEPKMLSERLSEHIDWQLACEN